MLFTFSRSSPHSRRSFPPSAATAGGEDALDGSPACLLISSHLFSFPTRPSPSLSLGRNSMEDLYSIHPGISRMEDYTSIRSTSSCEDGSTLLPFHDSPLPPAAGETPDLPDYLIKARIATHPRYPSLLSAYIDCQKVGAPPEISALLEEIGQEKYQVAPGELGADPELDEFMESYCRVLVRYKEELSKPFDEAASFLSSVEAQLRSLCSIDCPATSAASAAAGANASSISGTRAIPITS